VAKDDSLSALEHEIEQTREHLATTIDQLLYRVHPRTIASREVSSIKAHYVDRRTGQPRTDNILKTVGIVVGVVVTFAIVRKVVR
jgi:Protein of unknown function (DUF3618)